MILVSQSVEGHRLYVDIDNLVSAIAIEIRVYDVYLKILMDCVNLASGINKRFSQKKESVANFLISLAISC